MQPLPTDKLSHKLAPILTAHNPFNYLAFISKNKIFLHLSLSLHEYKEYTILCKPANLGSQRQKIIRKSNNIYNFFTVLLKWSTVNDEIKRVNLL